MSRADSIQRVMYSDCEYMTLSEVSTTLKRRLEVELFFTRSNESKTNKGNAMEYTCRLPHMDPMRCPILSEGIMLSFRHDVLHVTVPPPSLPKTWSRHRRTTLLACCS